MAWSGLRVLGGTVVTAGAIVLSAIGAYKDWPWWAYVVVVPLIVLGLGVPILLDQRERRHMKDENGKGQPTPLPSTGIILSNIGRAKVRKLKTDADVALNADSINDLDVEDIDNEWRRRNRP